tara:strand:+ start:45 stop:1118 length:1074 start_codon:yes stop_codon:yes gene_type:complete
MSTAKDRYIPWKCAACGHSNTKGTNLPETLDSTIECRGKCSQCSRNVRNVYRHVEKMWGPHGFETRGECLRFCDGLNVERMSKVGKVITINEDIERNSDGTFKTKIEVVDYNKTLEEVKIEYPTMSSEEMQSVAHIRFACWETEQERMKQEEAVAKVIEEERISNIKRQQEKAEQVRKEQEYMARRFSDDKDTLASKHHLEEWSTAMSAMSTMEIESYGEGWVRKKDLYNAFGKIYNLNSHSAINNRFNVISHIFQTHKMGACKYVKLINKPVSMKSAIDKRLRIVGNEKNAERKNTLTELPSAIYPKINNRVLPASVVHSNSELADMIHSNSELADMIVKRVFLMLTQHFEPVGEA